MKKYWLIFKLTLEEYFVYRLNFFLWRFRNIISFLVLFFFWEAVYQGKGEIFGYQKEQMLTYIVGVSFLKALVLGSGTADFAGMIKSGEIVGRFLLKPWRVVVVLFFRDLPAKILDVTFAFLEIFVVARIINLPIFWQKNLSTLFLFILVIATAFLTYFAISFLLSLIAFWVDNVWAPRWLFGVIFLEFFSGAFFPLDVLPKTLVNLINLTPFPYLVYFPIKIYLGKIPIFDIIRILFLMFFWLLALFYLVSFVWKKGLKVYSGYGG